MTEELREARGNADLRRYRDSDRSRVADIESASEANLAQETVVPLVLDWFGLRMPI